MRTTDSTLYALDIVNAACSLLPKGIAHLPRGPTVFDEPAIGRIDAVPTILKTVADITGMR